MRKPTFAIQTLTSETVAATRFRCPPQELGAHLGQAYGRIAERLAEAGLRQTGAPVARYLAHDGESFEIEAAIPTDGLLPADAAVYGAELPAGPAAVAEHVGPYDGLGATHEALRRWIAAEGLTPRGACWDAYVTDPGAEPDPADWRTHVVQPVDG